MLYMTTNNSYKVLATTVLSVLAVVFLAGSDVYGQGKSNTAPGQAKKETTSTQTQTTEQKEKNVNEKKLAVQEQEVVVGSVETIKGNTFQVEEKKGNKQVLTVDPKTEFVGKDNKPVKIGAIKVKDVLALIGSTEETDSTTAAKFKVKKVFVQEASESAQMKRRAVQGIITSIADGVITLAHQIQQDRTYTILFNEETYIKAKEASESATMATLTVGLRIAAVGDIDENGTILAKRIHVIPGKATGVFKKQPVTTPVSADDATPSADVNPTASASANPTIILTSTPVPTLPDETPTPIEPI
jgi:hypothetical protein